MFHADLKNAFPQAYAAAPCGIAYYQGKGWRHYNLKTGPGDGVPEFFIAKQGVKPIPLTNEAAQAWGSLVRSLIMGRRGYSGPH